MPRRRGKRQQPEPEEGPEGDARIVSSPDRGTALLRFAAQMQRELQANDDKGWGFTEEDRGRLLAILSRQRDQMAEALLAGEWTRFVNCCVDMANMALIVAETVPAEFWPEAEALRLANCAFVSDDGVVCRALEAPMDQVMGRIASMRAQQQLVEEATVQFPATFSGGTMNAKGELTVSLKPHVGDPWALHRDSVEKQGRSVNVSLLFPVPVPGGGPDDQQTLPLGEVPPPEPVDMIVCSSCHRIARGEGVEPGTICGFCLEGELQIVGVVPMLCSNCHQPQEMGTVAAGDLCTLCKEGRYLIVGQTPAPQEPHGPPQGDQLEPEGEIGEEDVSDQPPTGLAGSDDPERPGEEDADDHDEGEQPSE